LRTLAAVHGVKYVICAPHNIIGPRQKYDDPYRNVAAIMINLMLQGRQPIIYGDGTQMRCFSDIRDVVGSLVRMLDDDSAVGEVINIGPDDEFIDINTLAETIAELIGFDLHPVYVPDRPREVKLACCSADKARALLQYRTRHTLKESLREMIEWIKQRGTRQFEYHLPIEIPDSHFPVTWKSRMF